MSLLVTRDQLLARRSVAAGPLAPLANGLREELAPLLAAPREVPAGKALLSRAGGRCDVDGTLLTYDPFDARHRCPRCARQLTGEVHDRFRLYWHHLWLAERVAHAALLGVVLDDADCRALAEELLDAYATQYLTYPNRDNVLGPSRPFFSTYLESIWLLQVAIALDLLETGDSPESIRTLGARVRDRLIAPSAALIVSYDEGMSNRQVWNNSALYAAGRLLDDEALCDRALLGASGLRAHLESALLPDGSWYEGENYHLFAHRGLWYGVQLAETSGYELPAALASRFRDGFAAPFRTLLPDLTYPSRRDSQYAVSIRQPRFAESCELGLARGDDDRLLGILARLYDPSVPRGDIGRASTSADAERNLPATGLTRADLSWRSLLLARSELPPLHGLPLASDLMPAQGIAILRRDAGSTYVALDYGHSGGGHGHPDRLNLLLVDGDTRWFDDPGTGSYVDPSLHWYRSTLAHSAPLVDGRSQPRVHGRLVAFDESGSAGWVSARAELAPGLTVVRSVVVCDDYLIDLLQWESATEHEVALPMHGVDLVDARDVPLPRVPRAIPGGDAREDGFSFLEESAIVTSPPSSLAHVLGVEGSRRLRGWIATGKGTSWWSARAPDVPSRPGRRPLMLARSTSASGSVIAVWSWRDAISDVELRSDEVVVVRRDGGRDRHAAVPEGWRVGLEGRSGRAPSHVVLGGLVRVTPEASTGLTDTRGGTAAATALPARFELGDRHYRRSEESWSEAGEPRALVEMRREAPSTLAIEVDVAPSHRIFVPIDAENALDNEPAAINGDGVQLYVASGGVAGGWLLAPDPVSDAVSVRAVDGWPNSLEVRATWQPTATGWRLSARVPLPRDARDMQADVIVNESAPGRARRRGQLVLSGANGEFVYLRGDRHDPERLLRFSLADV